MQDILEKGELPGGNDRKPLALLATLVLMTLAVAPISGQVEVTAPKLTITGGGTPLPPPAPFPPVTISTEKLTITGGGTPLPPKPPFPGVTVTTQKLTISGVGEP